MNTIGMIAMNVNAGVKVTPEIFEEIVRKVGIHGKTLWSDKENSFRFQMDYATMASEILIELEKQGYGFEKLPVLK